MNWRSLLTLATAILLLLFTLAVLSAADPLSFKETDLEPLEPVYDALDLDRPLLRCGQLARLVHNPAQMVIIFNYKWERNSWFYTVRKCHYSP